MKNRQLMRLNKVLHKGEVRTVDCIAPGNVSFLEDRHGEDKWGKWIDLDEVEFVPLNEEWLTRFGFEYVPEYFGWADKSHCIRKDNDGFSFEPYCTNDDDCYIHIKYVHQLQNLFFSLTGEELVIKDGI